MPIHDLSIVHSPRKPKPRTVFGRLKYITLTTVEPADTAIAHPIHRQLPNEQVGT